MMARQRFSTSTPNRLSVVVWDGWKSQEVYQAPEEEFAMGANSTRLLGGDEWTCSLNERMRSHKTIIQVIFVGQSSRLK